MEEIHLFIFPVAFNSIMSHIQTTPENWKQQKGKRENEQ